MNSEGTRPALTEEWVTAARRLLLTLSRRVRQRQGLEGVPLELLVYSPGLMIVKPLQD